MEAAAAAASGAAGGAGNMAAAAAAAAGGGQQVLAYERPPSPTGASIPPPLASSSGAAAAAVAAAADGSVSTSTTATAAAGSGRAHKRDDYLHWDDYFMAVAFLSAMRSKGVLRWEGCGRPEEFTRQYQYACHQRLAPTPLQTRRRRLARALWTLTTALLALGTTASRAAAATTSCRGTGRRRHRWTPSTPCVPPPVRHCVAPLRLNAPRSTSSPTHPNRSMCATPR